MKKILNLTLNTVSSVVLGMSIFGNISKAQAVTLVNGGFEQPAIPVQNNFAFFNETIVPGWDTTSESNAIEIHTRRLFIPGALNTD